ncbi:MAG: cation diffusion facilitator family transporter [Casimicrobiaceae bacterium]
MSSSVSISIATNSAIAVSKGFGWFVTGSPTLFAETVHSLADVGNQVLLKIGEVRGRRGPDLEHPFGRGQEKFFWALVSAVSVFFIGCGINIYHGVHALMVGGEVGHFTPLVLGLLLFSLALEAWTFAIAWKEIGGRQGVKDNRHDTTVIAVLLEDGVALFGIFLTLMVAGVGYVYGPHPEFDAAVAIAVGAILGGMALFLAAINRRILIDTSDRDLDRAARTWLAERGIAASVHSLVLDNDRAIVFVRPQGDVRESRAVGSALTAHLAETLGKSADAVYWEFPA